MVDESADSASSVEAVLASLGASLDEAASLPLGALPPAELLALAEGLQQVRARAEALVCAAAVAAGTAEIPALEGRRSIATVVAARTGVSPRVIAADVRIGAWLDGFPVFRESFGGGALSRPHVEAIRRVDNTRTRHRLREAQEYLVAAAAECDWSEFTQVLRYWVLAFDPDGPAPEEAVAARFCRVGKDGDGAVVGAFRLDPIAGQAFVTALQQEEQRLFRAEADRGPEPANPIRTASQRRADALLGLAVRGAGRSDGTVPAPLVHLVLSEQVAERLLVGNDPALDARSLDGRCELIDGTPIHPRAALDALARAAFRRQVLRARSETLDLGRRVRSFPPPLKQALLVAARGRCASSGCDAPVGWLQADHVHPFAKDGPTALWNGQILCDPHNKRKGDAEP